MTHFVVQISYLCDTTQSEVICHLNSTLHLLGLGLDVFDGPILHLFVLYYGALEQTQVLTDVCDGPRVTLSFRLGQLEA